MKLTKYLHRACVGLATVGLLLPNPGLVQGAEKQLATKQVSPKIIDVSLVDGGVLQGQVISSQGQALANAPITLHQGKSELAMTTTDKNGQFAVKGLKGGVYVVSTEGAAGVVRAWMPQTAPPSSVNGILLVPEAATTRAQKDDYYDGSSTNLGLGALVVGGIVATVIAVAIDHNSAS